MEQQLTIPLVRRTHQETRYLLEVSGLTAEVVEDLMRKLVKAGLVEPVATEEHGHG